MCSTDLALLYMRSCRKICATASPLALARSLISLEHWQGAEGFPHSPNQSDYKVSKMSMLDGSVQPTVCLGRLALGMHG